MTSFCKPVTINHIYYISPLRNSNNLCLETKGPLISSS